MTEKMIDEVWLSDADSSIGDDLSDGRVTWTTRKRLLMPW